MNGVVDLGFFFGGQTDALGIAATLDIEDTLVSPDVLVVANQVPVTCGAECRLPSTGKAEEECDIAILTDIATGVQGKVTFLGHEIVHDGEDTLLHFTGVLGAEDDHLALLEVEGDGGRANDPGNMLVGVEFAGVEDIVVGSFGEVFFQFLPGRFHQHVVHEKGVVGPCADHPDFNPLLRIPTSVSVHHVQFRPSVQVVYG